MSSEKLELFQEDLLCIYSLCIQDEFYLSIPEMDAREGWLSQLNATISGDSPVVWTVSATFQTGRVISMYDADAPSEPRSTTFVPCDINGKISGEGGYTGTNTKLKLSWVIPVESGGSGIDHYNLYVNSAYTKSLMKRLY